MPYWLILVLFFVAAIVASVLISLGASVLISLFRRWRYRRAIRLGGPELPKDLK